MCTNRAEFAEVFWASRRAGWRITTINWRLTGEESAYIVADSDAKAFIVEERFADAARLVRARAARAELMDYCRARLADYNSPRSIDFDDSLPRHDSGVAGPLLNAHRIRHRE